MSVFSGGADCDTGRNKVTTIQVFQKGEKGLLPATLLQRREKLVIKKKKEEKNR